MMGLVPVFGILLTIAGVVCAGRRRPLPPFLALGWLLAFRAVMWFFNAFPAFGRHGFFLAC